MKLAKDEIKFHRSDIFAVFYNFKVPEQTGLPNWSQNQEKLKKKAEILVCDWLLNPRAKYCYWSNLGLMLMTICMYNHHLLAVYCNFPPTYIYFPD